MNYHLYKIIRKPEYTMSANYIEYIKNISGVRIYRLEDSFDRIRRNEEKYKKKCNICLLHYSTLCHRWNGKDLPFEICRLCGKILFNLVNKLYGITGEELLSGDIHTMRLLFIKAINERGWDNHNYDDMKVKHAMFYYEDV